MNWIEIDKILYGIISRHDSLEDMIKEAKTQFKWSRSQAEAAIKPLLKRHTFKKVETKTVKTRSKPLTKKKKTV